jgi:hypothetical protein
MVFDTVTGAPQLTVHPTAATWGAKLDGGAQGSCTIPLRGFGTLPRGFARNLLLVNARMIAHIDENDTVIAAGVILRTVYNRDTGAVTANWVDIRELFRQRLPFGVLSWGPSGTLNVEDRTYAGAVRAILYRGMGSGDQPAWDLPIALPPDEGPGSFTKKWNYYDVPIIDDMLREVEKEGIEIYFDPYIASNGHLRFATRVGRRIALGDPLDLPATTPETRVSGLTVTIDGSKQLTGVFVVGTGTEADTKVAGAGHGPYDIPVRDARRAAKDVKSTTRLQRIADAALEDNFDYIVQRSYGVRLGSPVNAGHVKPGHLLRMDVQGDDWLADLRTTQRVLSVSGDLTENVKVESQSYGG